MRSPESFSSRQKRPERQSPSRFQPDSDDLKNRFVELDLGNVNKILINETNELLRNLIQDFDSLAEDVRNQKRKEVIDELKGLRDRKALEDWLEQKGLKDRIVNLFGLVYIPSDYKVIAVTDIHGDIYALQEAVERFENEKKKGNTKVAFVCMGDFVDRGDYSFEVVKRLFKLKREYESDVVIMKGDHEVEETIAPKEFREKLLKGGGLEEYGKLKEAFDKLPYMVVYGDSIISHSSLPFAITINEENGRINPSKPPNEMIIGDMIGIEDQQYLKRVYFDDILEGVSYSENQYRGSVKNFRVYTIPIGGVALALRNLGLKRLIRGHDIRLFNPEQPAHQLTEVNLDDDSYQVINFHSNQNYYANKEKKYKNACYLFINGDQITYELVGRQSESLESTMTDSSSQRQQPNIPGRPNAPEQQQPNAPEQRGNLNDRLKELLGNFRKRYEEYIDCLDNVRKQIIDNFINNFVVERFVNVNLIPVEFPQYPDAADAHRFLQIQPEMDEFFKLFLAELLLSDKEVVKDERKRKKAEEFIEKELSINDLERLIRIMDMKNYPGYILNFKYLNGEVVKEVLAYEINEEWRDYLIINLARKLKTKEDLEKYLKTIIKTYRKNLKILKENLEQSPSFREMIRSELARSLGREPSEGEVNQAVKERIDQIVEDLEKAGDIENHIDQLMKADDKQLNEMLNFFKEFNEEIENSRKEGRKFDFKKILPALNKLKDIVGIILGGVGLWGIMLGFFLPLYLIDKMYGAIEKGALMGGRK